MSVAPIALPRAVGEARVVFKRRDEATVLQDLYQQGCCKVRFPRIDPGEPLQAVLLNTAGGLTDGDQVRQALTWQEDTQAVVTTQAAERIYRSRSEMAVVHNSLEVRAGARAIWLPQETILFEGARLERHWRADLASDAMLFAAETWTLGRAAMGETVTTGALTDAWEIYRDGRLLWADRLVFDSDRVGDLAAWAARPAVLAGNTTLLTLVVIAPEPQVACDAANATLDAVDTLSGATRIGDLVLIRALAKNAAHLRTTLLLLIDRLQSVAGSTHPLHGCRVPRVFDC
ncbi:MAG: urease accessory protein UreD [Pseudomonadota bacterium]